MSIAPPVGAMSAYLSRLSFRQDLPTLSRGGKTDQQASAEGAGQPRQPCRRIFRGFMMDGGTLFEELGFYYVGRSTVIISTICCPSEDVRDMETGPILSTS